MPRTLTRRPSSRELILDAALGLVRTGSSISLESAARAAGITKPGLMYHFPTKESLMTALVDRLMDTYEKDLTEQLDGITIAESSVEGRLLAYLDWVCETEFDFADLVMFADPKYRGPLTTRWSERIEPWLVIPEEVGVDRRAQLMTARLACDGVWFAISSGCVPLTAADRASVRRFARQLILGDS